MLLCLQVFSSLNMNIKFSQFSLIGNQKDLSKGLSYSKINMIIIFHGLMGLFYIN